MNRKHMTLRTAALVLLLAGCDRVKPVPSDPVPKREVQPPTATVIPAPTTSPSAAAQPTHSVPLENVAATPPISTTLYFQILEDRARRYPFPRARLHINANEHTVVLYSDDPKTAIDPDYVGNSFYLVIPLDKNQQLDNYQWDYKAPSGGDEPPVSTDGIYLAGQRYHLQPSDMHVAFKVDGDKTRFALWGDFVKFDSKARNAHLGFDVKVESGVQPVKVDTEK